MESLRGYEIKGRKGLAHWSALLEEWLLAIERYCRIDTGKEDEIVEAKFQWIVMGSNKTPELVERSMNSAVTDAKASKNDSDIKAIGAGFFPLYKKSTRIQEGEIDHLIEQTIGEFRGFDHHALAWCFPPEMREFEHEVTKNALPGVILLVKNCEHCVTD